MGTAPENKKTEAQPGRFLSPAQVCRDLGITRQWLWQLTRRGKFPRFLDMGKNLKRLPVAEYEAYIAGLPRQTFSSDNDNENEAREKRPGAKQRKARPKL